MDFFKIGSDGGADEVLEASVLVLELYTVLVKWICLWGTLTILKEYVDAEIGDLLLITLGTPLRAVLVYLNIFGNKLINVAKIISGIQSNILQ